MCVFCSSIFLSFVYASVFAILIRFWSRSVCCIYVILVFLFQESEEEKRDRLLRELSDDTKVQKKKPWYGLF